MPQASGRQSERKPCSPSKVRPLAGVQARLCRVTQAVRLRGLRRRLPPTIRAVQARQPVRPALPTRPRRFPSTSVSSTDRQRGTWSKLHGLFPPARCRGDFDLLTLAGRAAHPCCWLPSRGISSATPSSHLKAQWRHALALRWMRFPRLPSAAKSDEAAPALADAACWVRSRASTAKP